MKKIQILFFNLLFSSVAFVYGQNEVSEKKIDYGLSIGLNFANLKVNDTLQNYAIKETFGFEMKYDLENIYFRTGIYLAEKGGKLKDDVGIMTNYQLYYFDLPLTIGYKIPKTKFTIGGAFYMGYAFFGSSKNSQHTDIISFNSIDNKALNPLNYGLNIDMGYGFGDIGAIRLSYDIGLQNLANNDNKIYNRIIALTVYLSIRSFANNK